MKKYTWVRIVSFVLIMTTVLSCIIGCSNVKDNGKRNDKGNGKAAVGAADTTGGITSKTANVKGPKTGPVGKWDIPIPEINPLGSQDLYQSTRHEKSLRVHHINYIEDFTENHKFVNGEIWTLVVEDTSGIPLEFLKEYAQDLGANIFSTAYGDRLSFSYKKDEDSMWWGDAYLKSSGYELTVIREKHVPAGKEVGFNTADADEDNREICFVTQTDGKRFQSAVITLPNGGLDLTVKGEYRTGILTRYIHYNRTSHGGLPSLSSKKTNTFILDDLPQGSDALEWHFTWKKDSAPSEFTFKLVELDEIPQVKHGDEPGALKVCGIPYGLASVKPQNGVTYKYAEEYSLQGDITPEGDTIFWLPSGLWDLDIPSKATGLEYCYSRLIPVSSCEMTVVTIPDSLNSAYSALNQIYAGEGSRTGSITIAETKDEGSTASISMIVNDPDERDVFPTKENTTIREGNQKVEILEITRKVAPPSVVLVLDSSGSMGRHMQGTLTAARDFIQGLPDSTFVKVIDFDSQIRILKGDTKDAVIKDLASVKAQGSTKLYDATLEGLKLLKGKNRPALVVFADGADSREDGQGAGSSAAKDKVIDAVKEAKIPLYTIGFGDGADKQALKDFSAASGGNYYGAEDNEALAKVFEAIGDKFGNMFDMKYKRPTEKTLSDIPVVSLIMDASGSMDTDPAEHEDCGYRMDRTKALFHDFVLKLPEQCLMQMVSFQQPSLSPPHIIQSQITTDEKVKVLQAIGSMKADGGTPVLRAIRAGYENLKAVPTNKRVIVFVTDAGLEVDEEDQTLFEDLLGNIKKDNITVLWAGMGVMDKEELFKKAAELSGGRYVVKENAEDLKAALEEILGLINEEGGSECIPISIAINEKTASGDVFNYSAAMDAEFSRPAKAGKAEDPQVVKLSTGTPLKRYDKDAAEMVTGNSVIREESILKKRIAVKEAASNKCMTLSVKEAFCFSMLKKLKAPGGKQFLILNVEMKNITPNNIQYHIPSFKNHFYLTINNEGSYPATDVTWLTEIPVSAPGDPGINIFPDKNITGMMAFIVPDDAFSQISLHFYDAVHGHIHVPLIGKVTPKFLQLDGLPAAGPAKITDAFSMTVTAAKMLDKIDNYKAEQDTAFRVIEADFNTNVQALLDIDPVRRFLLKINTNTGPLMTKMSNVTEVLPFGFMSPVMLTPSSANKVRFAYPVANALSETQAVIWGDLRDGSLEIPVADGKAFGNAVNKPFVTAQGLQLRINHLTTLDGIEGYHDRWAVADVTFSCPKDSEGAFIPKDVFFLVREDYLQGTGGTETSSAPEAASSAGDGAVAERKGLGNFGYNLSGSPEGICLPNYDTTRLLYGIDEDWGVYSGTQRRGLVLFLLPNREHKWTLKSNYFIDLKEPLVHEQYAAGELLVNKTDIKLYDADFEKLLSEAVQKAVLSYQSYKSSEGGTGFTKTVDLATSGGSNNIPVPSVVTHGIEKMRHVKTIEQVISTMQSLIWLPGKRGRWTYRYSPEAVLTQGWGTEWDLGYLATGLISKCGYAAKRRLISLTEAGKSKLLELYGISHNVYNLIEVPGVAYTDENGNGKLFVVPFMKDISELEGLAYIPSNQDLQNEYMSEIAEINVYAKTESKSGTQYSVASPGGHIVGALGGSVEDDTVVLEDVQMLSRRISLPELSTGAVEIGYVEAGMDQGACYVAAINTAGGVETGKIAIDTGIQKILGIKIEIKAQSSHIGTHEITIADGDKLDGICHNIGINLPDLPKDAVTSLQRALDKEYKAAVNPSPLSMLKWYGRNIINRFITAQTAYDNEMKEGMSVALGRTDKIRSLMVTSRANEKDSKFRTSFDMLNVINQCHSDDRDTVAAYNIGASIFASILEGDALTAKDKASFLDLWARAPEGASLQLIPCFDSPGEEIIDGMKKAGYPERLINSVMKANKMIITLDTPVVFDGQKRWAWVEINPDTYEIISVMDTGEHGATEFISLKSLVEDAGKFELGSFIGFVSAIWSVAGYSLELDNYNDILANAYVFAKGVGEYIDWVLKGYSAARDKKFSVWDGIKLATGEDLKGDLPVFPDIKIGAAGIDFELFRQRVVNFKKGYDFALKVYFAASRIKEQEPKK